MDDLIWSPTKNEFVTSIGCRGDGDTTIYFVSFSNPDPVDITPTELSCYVNILWHPNGSFFYMSAETNDIEEWGSIYTWKVESENLLLSERELGSYYWGWLNDEMLVTERRIGTGIFSINIFNVVSMEGMGGTSFDGTIVDTSNSYVVLQSPPYDYSSVAILSQNSVSPEFEGCSMALM